MPAEDSTVSYLGDDDSDYFREVHGRTLNALNHRYMLPVDQDEVKRSELHHRMLQFVFNGKNYIGPVRQALQFGQQRRVLDLGTGGGFWAVDMADEFPRAEVIGVDLAPIQPRTVPVNCTFELCDLDQPNIPYPDNHFDVIHARSMHTGIHDYPRFLQEVARLLRPGGLVIIIEPDLTPVILPSTPSSATPAPVASSSSSSASSSSSSSAPAPSSSSQASSSSSSASASASASTSSSPSRSRARTRTPTQHHASSHNSNNNSENANEMVDRSTLRGWFTLWETYRACLRRQGIDITVPQRLTELLNATNAFELITAQNGNIPVGFWPTDLHLLTVGQLQWMDYELFLPALAPLFLDAGLGETNVKSLIEEAQADLYFPAAHHTIQLHIVHASKLL